MQVFISMNDVKAEQKKWIDARFSLQDEERGSNAYRENHIAGAAHWDLAADLSDKDVAGGRHMLPSKEKLTELFRKTGLELDDTIVIYDDGGSPFALRAWWILYYAGFRNAYVLYEGFNELQAAGLETSSELAAAERSAVQPVWRDDVFVDRTAVEQVVAGARNAKLVDARAAVRYRGEYEPLDKKAGHIPTAQNFDWELLKTDGKYDVTHAAPALDKIVSAEDDIIVYCGSGVSATPLFAALKELDYPNVRLYAGSFSDWISDDDAPVETV